MSLISIIIPAFNEEKNIPVLYGQLLNVFQLVTEKHEFEVIFINDGSQDGTGQEIEKIMENDNRVKYIEFSRNFGKEVATTAGINSCLGDACIMIDSDLQHPVNLIPKFIEKWESGLEVVVGVRSKNPNSSLLKKIGSKLFYQIINRIGEIKVVPNATDYRLLDRIVIDEFNRFTEANRMTRALIDWLGFKRDYIYFKANERIHGSANYSFWKLTKLAVNGFVSLSLVPLKLAGYLGLTITLISGIFGCYILFGKYFFHTPFASTFSDAENLAILLVFLVGIILVSIGLIALYIANIHGQVINRPMYVVRNRKADGNTINKG